MGQEFYFEYEPQDPSCYEVAPVGGGFAAFLNFNSQYSQRWHLWPSFVQEFRNDWETLEESWARKDAGDTGDEENAEDADEDMDKYEVWGPSRPFAPSEVRNWATRWIKVLNVMSDEQAKVLFRLYSELHIETGPYGRAGNIADLEKLISQADCAERHGVQMTMHMVWD